MLLLRAFFIGLSGPSCSRLSAPSGRLREMPFSKSGGPVIRPSLLKTGRLKRTAGEHLWRPALDTLRAIDYVAAFLFTTVGQIERHRPGRYRLVHCADGRARSRKIAELCCVLDFAGKPALPALLGRGVNLAGPSGYWVGHSSGSFAVGLLSVREPSLRARLPRIFSNPSMVNGQWSMVNGQWLMVNRH